MKASPFAYFAPDTLQEALDLLGSLDNAKILAGGQSLMAMLNLRYAMPDQLVDINGISDLAGVTDQGGRLSIGAMTRQRVLERDSLLFQKAPIFREALLQVGHIQTRNRGTIGGSLCHLDPAAELPALAMLYDATLIARSAKGERALPMAEFPAFYMTPALEPDEILTRIDFDPWPQDSHFAFVEFSRRHGDFAIVAAGCLFSLSPSGTIERAAIVLGGVGAAPMRLTEAENSLIGQVPGRVAFEAAARAAQDIEAMEDSVYSAQYRCHLSEVMTRRALTKAWDRHQERAA